MTYDFVGTVSLDKGRKALSSLVSKYEAKQVEWNEADTRFQFIDLFLTKCLGWPRDVIRVEKHQDGQYTDYELGNPRAIIWEAKREGKYFELLANPSKKLILPLSDIISISDEVKEAVIQAQAYCSSRGSFMQLFAMGTS